MSPVLYEKGLNFKCRGTVTIQTSLLMKVTSSKYSSEQFVSIKSFANGNGLRLGTKSILFSD